MSIGKSRLAVNVVGSAIVAVACAALCISLVGQLSFLSPPRHGDPDGDKGIVVTLAGIAFLGLVGTAAVISLIRTARAWKGTGKE